MVALVWRGWCVSRAAQNGHASCRSNARDLANGMSKPLIAYLDRVVDASMAPTSKAMAPVVRGIEKALDSADGYEEAEAALRRLEGKARADGLEPLLKQAMMLGTSAGSVKP
jgi:phage gp29-like protein